MSKSKAQMNRIRGEIIQMKENCMGLKPNFSAVGRQLGITRQTAAKLWNDPVAPSKPRQKKKSKFDPYYNEIREMFESNSTATIKAIYKFFENKYPAVFTSYNSFKAYIRANKLKDAAEQNRLVHIRYETEPGKEVQFDWKENLRMTLTTGEVIEFNLFGAVYGYSRFTKFIFSKTKTTVDVLRCLIDLMVSAGGCPSEFKTDNMSAVVTTHGKKKRKLPLIVQFEKDTDTKIKLCKIHSPQSKGKVESANRFVEWLMVYNGKLNSEEELIEKIHLLNRQINKEPCRTTGIPRVVMFQKEKEHLKPLTRVPLLESYLKDVETQTVPPTLLVYYQGHGYSVPKKFIDKRVKITRMSDEVQIYYNNQLICTHPIRETPINYHQDHYVEALKDTIKPKENEDVENYEDRIRKKALKSLELMNELKGSVK